MGPQCCRKSGFPGKASFQYEKKICPRLARALESEEMVRDGGFFGRIILTVGVHGSREGTAQLYGSCLPSDLRL